MALLRERKGREGDGRDQNGREQKGIEENGRERKGASLCCCFVSLCAVDRGSRMRIEDQGLALLCSGAVAQGTGRICVVAVGVVDNL